MTEKTVEIVSGIEFTMRTPTLESVRRCVDMAHADLMQYQNDPFSIPKDMIPDEHVDLTNGSHVIGRAMPKSVRWTAMNFR